MRWSPSKLENNGVDGLYRRNQVKSITFLAMLGGILVLTILLSLRAGSYETPLAELVRGIFGRSADRKINIVVQHNRLPRICTGILAGAGLGLAGCAIPWPRHPPWVLPRVRPSARPLPSWFWALAAPAALASSSARFWALLPWR